MSSGGIKLGDDSRRPRLSPNAVLGVLKKMQKATTQKRRPHDPRGRESPRMLAGTRVERGKGCFLYLGSVEGVPSCRNLEMTSVTLISKSWTPEVWQNKSGSWLVLIVNLAQSRIIWERSVIEGLCRSGWFVACLWGIFFLSFFFFKQSLPMP